jgi:hypothetical protein
MTTIFGLDIQLLLNPVLTAYLPLIILSFALDLLLDIYLLWRGRWTTATRLAKIGINLFSHPAQLLIRHNAWLARQGIGFLISLEALPSLASTAGITQVWVMQAFRLTFIIALIMTIIETIGQGYQLVKRLFGRPVSPQLPA